MIQFKNVVTSQTMQRSYDDLVADLFKSPVYSENRGFLENMMIFLDYFCDKSRYQFQRIQPSDWDALYKCSLHPLKNTD